jgi:hypothetical protein
MIFPVLKIESKVQVNEKTRISGIKSYTSTEEASVSLIRIKPSASDSFIEVSAIDPTDYVAWYLDWQYSTAGTKTIDLEITTDGSAVVSQKTIEVVLSATEKLFSSDEDLVSLEPDILNYVKDGKNSFNDFHRQSQSAILDEIYRNRIMSTTGEKITVDEVLDVSEVKFWSLYMTLNKIFRSISNKPDDVFADRAKYYEKKELEAFNQAMNQMRIDYNKDGVLDDTESYNLRTVDVFRR